MAQKCEVLKLFKTISSNLLWRSVENICKLHKKNVISVGRRTCLSNFTLWEVIAEIFPSGMQNANMSIWKRMIKDRKKWLLDRFQFFQQNCPVDLLNQNSTRSLCTFWSQIAIGKQRSKVFWSGSAKKLQWSLKTFLFSQRHSGHAKSVFITTSKRLTTRSW